MNCGLPYNEKFYLTLVFINLTGVFTPKIFRASLILHTFLNSNERSKLLLKHLLRGDCQRRWHYDGVDPSTLIQVDALRPQVINRLLCCLFVRFVKWCVYTCVFI